MTTETKKILLCDDDTDSREFMAIVLRNSGYCIDSASSHAEFFSKYLSFKPNLIILDIALPEHDGFWIAEELQKLKNKAALIFISAHSKTVYRWRAPRAGAVDYLLKPFDPDVLLQRAANALRPDAASSNWFLTATCRPSA